MSVPSLAFAPSLLAASGFEYALQQPLFPGKILIWTLFMLSLLTWAVMISKLVSFFRMRRADEAFDRQFRASRQPLQLFERDFSDEMSMRWLVYEHGAHEAAFQMLGSPDRDATFGTRLDSAEGMTANQMNAVREAFRRGEEAAAARIRLGMPVLSVAAAGAPFLGLLGLVWILMRTFSAGSAAEGMSAVAPGISGGLAVMVVALLVATPAIIGQILIAAHGRERLRKLGSFKDDALRMMERFYLSGAAAPEVRRDRPVASLQEEAVEVAREQPDEPEREEALVEDQSAAAEEFIEPAPVPVATDQNFVQDELLSEVELAVKEEAPLTEIESPFEAVEEGFLEDDPEPEAVPEDLEEATEAEVGLDPERKPRVEFRTPFTEPEINPIAQQTAGILANSTA